MVRIENMRVLVCDDQADVVEALRLLLKGAGYRIDTVDSPSSLISRLEHTQYDMILMDMNYSRDTTSGAEGLELVASVRARSGPVPIVVMTAWSSVDLAVEAMQRGASDFVQKPWDNNKLLAVVEKQIARGSRKSHSELEIARTVQQGLFPQSGGSADGIEFEGLCVPAREIGGDYYDFLRFPDGRTGFVLADVSGKGVPAALLMANLQALFRSQPPNQDLLTTLQIVNSLFFRSTPPAHYATAFIAIWDPLSRKLTYANCGHPSAIVFDARGGMRKLETTATVLGIMDHFEADIEQLELMPGDTALLFTDGVTEAGLDFGDEFGEDRIEAVMRRMQGMPVAELVAAVARAAEEYSRGDHADDMTLVGLRVTSRLQ